jgi:signal transduction histidine kinase/ligand-binding sensor domain-containing protein
VPFASIPFGRLACALATCAALAAPLLAQENTSRDLTMLPFRLRQGWNTQLGLPQGTISAIVEDSLGFLWLGTFGGMVRFDGNEFEVFDQSRVPELRSNYISSLHMDREGTLWIGTAEGQLLHLRDGTFHSHDAEHGLAPGALWKIVELADGRILACSDGGLTAWRRSGRQSLPAGLAGIDSALWAEEDGRGSLWIAGRKGLFRWDGASLERLAAPDGTPFADAHWVDTFGNGDVVALTDRGLAWFRGDGVHLDDSVTTATNSAAYRSERLDDKTILLATDPQLLLLRMEEERIATERFQVIPGSTSRTFHFDRHGQLWVGSANTGLTCHARDGVRPMSNQYLRLEEGNKSFAASATGDPWVASTGSNRLHRINPRTGACPITATLPVATDGAGVRGLVELEDARLLVNADIGLHVLQGTEWKRLGEAVAGFQTPMLRAADGSVWIGGRGTLVRVRGEQVEDVGTAVGFPKSAMVHALTQSKGGSLWVGTQDALYCLKDDTLSHWTVADGLPVGQVRALLPLADGRLWIGTYGGGIACFDGTHIRKVAVDQGLMNNAVSRLDLDSNNRVWANTNLGAFSMRLEDLDAVVSGRASVVSCYPARTGEAGGPSGVMVDGRALLLPTVYGVTMLDLGIVEPPPVAPGILLTEFLANEQALDPRTNHFIPPGSRDLWFRFRGSDLLAPSSLRYRFRLVGYDSDWQDGNTETTARYTKVPPGAYRFEVQATNFRGLGSRIAHLDFVLEHSLLEQRWFQAVLACVAALVVIRGLTWRASMIRRRNRELSLEVERRTQAETAMRHLTHRVIRAQDEERSHVARELHDALGQRIALLGVNLDMLGQRSGVNPEMQRALAGLSDRVQSIAKEVHDISHRLHVAKLEQIGLVPALRSLCTEFQQAHGLEVQFSHAGSATGLREGTSHGLYRIAQEALQNVLRHSKAGSVGVHVAFRGTEVELVVRDDGIGFDTTRDGDEGLGLTSMTERASLMGGTLAITSEPGKGTVVTVRIPGSDADRASESGAVPTTHG